MATLLSDEFVIQHLEPELKISVSIADIKNTLFGQRMLSDTPPTLEFYYQAAERKAERICRKSGIAYGKITNKEDTIIWAAFYYFAENIYATIMNAAGVSEDNIRQGQLSLESVADHYVRFPPVPYVFEDESEREIGGNRFADTGL